MGLRRARVAARVLACAVTGALAGPHSPQRLDGRPQMLPDALRLRLGWGGLQPAEAPQAREKEVI